MADNDLPIKGLPDAGTIDPVNDMLPIEQAATGKVSPAALIALALQQTLTSFSAGANLPVNSADSIFSGFQKLQGQLNNKTTFQRITLAAINTAISASGLTYPGFYEIYDAVSATKRVVVFASSVSAVSSLAFNLTDNTFGSYNISTDAFTALAQPNSILNGIGAPSGSVGNNGDFYMDTAGIFLFGPKTSGAWGAGISLVPLEDIVVDTTFTASPYTPMSGRDQWIRVDTTDGNCTLNVSSSSVDGETYYISNAAGTHNVVFNTSLTIAPGNSALVKYDASTTTWLVLFTTGAAWGTLSGTLSSQTDLQSALDAKQNLLGFTAENVANKDTDGTLTANSDTRYPSQKAVKTYVDASVVGLLDDRGNFDASGNAFPSSGGSGASGAIRKGDLWYISVAGTLGSVPVMVGDSIRALNDAPGSTSANWDILNVGIGYVPENVANKDTDGTLSSNSDTKYASQKATKTYVDTGLSGKLSTSATTDAVTEGTTNKYFTTARVLATALTGYAAAGSRTAIAATDTVLQAFGKVGKYLGDLAAVAFSGSYSDLTGTPTALPPNGSAGGDLTGSYPNPTIKSNVALGGNPTTTTQTSGDNSTKIATTAFVQTAVASSGTSLIGSTNGITSSPTPPSGTYETWLGFNAGAGGGNTDGTVFIGSGDYDGDIYGAGYGASGALGAVFIGGGISAAPGAGAFATNAAYSIFIGECAGISAANATQSQFIGAISGSGATNANNSQFIGFNTGAGAGNANNSIFIGDSAGVNDTVNNSGGGHSMLIGDNASTGGFSNSIALGTTATNTQSNEFLVASSYNIWNIAGIPYVMPSSGAAGVLTNDGSGNLSWGAGGGTLIGQTSGVISSGTPVSGQQEVWLGDGAGAGGATTNGTVFIGASDSGLPGVGYGATAAYGSVFIGSAVAAHNGTGYMATNAWASVFIGTEAGQNATNASNSIFLGNSTGVGATDANSSTFIGAIAGSDAANANNSIFIGYCAGFSDTVNNSSSGTSILIGDNTNTGGFSNSIAIGATATNTQSNQFLVAASYNNWNIAGVPYVMPGSAGTNLQAMISDGSSPQNLTWQNVPVVVASADLTGLTTSNSTITYTLPSGTGTFRIGGYINMISSGAIAVEISYKDENGNSITKEITSTNYLGTTGVSLVTSIGNYSMLDFQIRATSGTPITISTLVSAGTYDYGATIERLR